MNAASAEAQAYAEFTNTTLKTELMAITIDELKAANDAWHKLGEIEQDDVIVRIEARVRDAVTQSLRLSQKLDDIGNAARDDSGEPI